jgi:tetratricopeptide (TPR) repeat protein
MALPTRLLALAFGFLLTAASLPDLFRKCKEQFQLGAYTDALQTLAALDKTSQEPGMERDRAALLPGLLFYRGASLAALGRTGEAEQAFEEYLALQPNAELDPGRYPRTVLAAFENAKKAVVSRGAGDRSGDASLAARYASFPPPDPLEVEKPEEGWAEGPVRFLLTTKEKDEFSRLGDTVARAEFVTQL